MKKVLMIIGGIVVGLVAIGVIVFLVVSMTSKKLVCKSSDGDITLMYTDDKLVGYTAVGADFDFDEQKEIAEVIGLELYLEQFEDWFETASSDGVCTRK